MRVIKVAVVFLAFSTSTALAYDKGAASGLAHVLALAGKCGYSVSPPKLEAYFKASGFDRPDALGWIKHKQNMESGWADAATVSDCTMAKTTAKSIDILN